MTVSCDDTIVTMWYGDCIMHIYYIMITVMVMVTANVVASVWCCYGDCGAGHTIAGHIWLAMQHTPMSLVTMLPN